MKANIVASRKIVAATDSKRMFSGKSNESRLKQTTGSKCMLMQPERLAIAMIDQQGWILRNKIKWCKQVLLKKQNRTIGSVMPASVKDRFNESGEELYFFVKNKKYYSDLDAVRLKIQCPDDRAENGFVRSGELYPNSKYNTNDPLIDGKPQFKASEEEIRNYRQQDAKEQGMHTFYTHSRRFSKYGKGSEY